PSRTTSRAVSAPMPDAPPLISATLFSRRTEDPPLGEAGSDAAVRDELRSRDEGGAVGGQPQDELAQIPRLGHMADRVHRTDQGLSLLVPDRLPERIEDRRVDAARMHRIAADVVLP